MTFAVSIGLRRAHELRRSLVENAFLLVAMYLLFVAIYVTVRSVGESAVSESSLSALMVGYLTFVLIQQTLQTFSAQVNAAAAVGTLEMLALAKPGLTRIFVAEFVTQTALEVVRAAGALLLIVLTTGLTFQLDIPRLIAILAPTLAAVAGLGLVIGGATLAYKRTGGLAALASLLVLVLVSAPVDRIPPLRLLPIADGSFLLRQVAAGQLSSLTFSRVLLLWAVGAVYLTVGVVAFAAFERVARDNGVLGHY